VQEARVITLIKFLLASAGREDPGNRELGVIHVVKFLYLVDLEYARQHEGETFTGIQWRFHHFGPWDAQAWALVEPTFAEVDADLRTFESVKFEGEGKRWRWTGDEADAALEEFRRYLPMRVAQEAKRLVHEFGSDTPVLLHHVYRTEPMLRAAPEDFLDFDTLSEHPPIGASPSQGPALTERQRRSRKKRVAAIRERVKASIEAKLAERRSQPVALTAPRYDAVFFHGVEALEAVAGEPLMESEGDLSVDDSVWKSETRGRSDTS